MSATPGRGRDAHGATTVDEREAVLSGGACTIRGMGAAVGGGESWPKRRVECTMRASKRACYTETCLGYWLERGQRCELRRRGGVRPPFCRRPRNSHPPLLGRMAARAPVPAGPRRGDSPTLSGSLERGVPRVASGALGVTPTAQGATPRRRWSKMAMNGGEAATALALVVKICGGPSCRATQRARRLCGWQGGLGQARGPHYVTETFLCLATTAWTPQARTRVARRRGRPRRRPGHTSVTCPLRRARALKAGRGSLRLACTAAVPQRRVGPARPVSARLATRPTARAHRQWGPSLTKTFIS